MEKILGVDLGTNSIGLTLREGNSFPWYGVYTFRKGVGEGKSGEFSLAAERTKHRSSRRLNNSRRYRIWETLKVLIEEGYCPLSIENLNNWKHYKKGTGRTFPIGDKLFIQWLKLDFNLDGRPDYSSPYQIRRQLVLGQLDSSIIESKYAIGRALFHIAQRRGFKSSRKGGANEKTVVYNGKGETRTIGRNEYENLILQHGSIGAAFAYLEDQNIRVRNRYTLRSDYEKEFRMIIRIQKLDNTEFCERIEKAIFFQRPLKSQKGLIGKCTLETRTLIKGESEFIIGKPRCPISHPKFEEYRAWAFINNIKFKNPFTNQFDQIPLELRERIFYAKFFYKSKREIQFKDIRKFIQSNGGDKWELNYSERMDEITISTCFVSARLQSVFGEDWESFKKQVTRRNKQGKDELVTYTINDIWHILFSFEDEEYFVDFLNKVVELEDKQIDELILLFNSFPVGYSNLSLKAIRNILPFLREGINYTIAVILAKVPELIGKKLFEDNKSRILLDIEEIIEEINFQKVTTTITNNLIFKYYALDYNERFGWKDTLYKLDINDIKSVETACIEHFGIKTWEKTDAIFQRKLKKEVAELYQRFFASVKREHIQQPHLVNKIKKYLEETYNVSSALLDRIYHPSQIDIYPKKEGQQVLLSPKTAAFKNPMAFKTLFNLRNVFNHLIEKGIIDSDTRIVVEVARDLNDSNKRWAIEKYQRDREIENMEFSNAISELINDSDFSGLADPNNARDIEKFRLYVEQLENYDEVLEKLKSINKVVGKDISKTELTKYRLWREQNCVCMYTGLVIKLTDLFDSNRVDFEHTIPRSKSFDNSLTNLTVCYANYNRDIKKNQMPTELPNYRKDWNGYSAIEPRLKPWQKRVDEAFKQVAFWKYKSRIAEEKTSKDLAIRQMHLRQMDYDYWSNKLQRFTQTEISQGFINSQLNDTQIISKYAYHYLKTVFNKVDVIKGINTSQFRKIFQIQPKSESKDRSTHAHHAVDAAVLTLIPSSQKKAEILKKSYDYEENNPGKHFHIKPFPEFQLSLIEEIKRNILINNIADKDRVLTIGRKIVRKRGRVIWLDRENKNPMVAQGDSIRGELHKQTYYGKIKIAAKDENGSLIRDESGSVVYNQVDGADETWMVIRKPIDKINFENDIIVDEYLSNFLRGQLIEGLKADELVDFQGNKIRHLRCRVKAARGFMNPENATIVKEQVYKSKKDYKGYLYADTGDNYMYGLYENENGRKIVSINTFESIKYSLNINRDTKEEIFRTIEPVMIGLGKKSSEAKLKHIFITGQKVLFFLESREELLDLSQSEISKRLYFIKRFHQAERGSIIFQHHLEARSDEKLNQVFGPLGKNGFAIDKLTKEFSPPRILFTPNRDVFIVEGKDFEMFLDGTLKFKF